MPLTLDNKKEIMSYPNVRFVEMIETPEGITDPNIFPFDTSFRWNRDHYGPVVIPSRGQSVELNLSNLPLYERLIDVYEDHDLEVRDGLIYIDGKQASSYTFEMDYYWMMGDNRHNSADSRYWGFVPEDHVVGKPLFVYFSLNKDKKFPGNIRWNRMFKKIR